MNRFVLLTLSLAGVLAGGLFFGGCDLAEVNNNPNEATEATPDALLANAQRDLAFETYGANPMMRGSNLWAQYTTQNFYPTSSRYATVDYGWGDFYNALNDLKKAKELSRQDGAPNTEAVALITQIWTYQILTDAYGDVPFKNALQESAQRSPAYTPQEEIYPALVDSLNVALNLIQPGQSGPSGDLIYGADMTKWQRFANALKMRIGMRAIDAAEGNWAETAITSANGNALQSNEDNATFQFGTSSAHRNTLYVNEVVDGRDDFDASDRFVNAMQQYGTQDPRMDAYFEQTSNTGLPCAEGSGSYRGFPYGKEQSAAQNLFASRPSCYYSKHEERFVEGESGGGDVIAPLMLYDEVLFIKAEAAARGIIGGGNTAAKNLLEDAIRASMRWYDVDDQSTEADNYVSAVRSDYSAEGFEQVIGEQKWIALYFNDIQGWSTWRRLDFEGHLKPPEGGNTGNLGGEVGVPLRVDYPQDEYSLNEENVKQAAKRQFGGVSNEHPGGQIWWDTDGPPQDALQ